MQLIDVLIVLALSAGIVTGFARGFIRQTVQSLGGIFVVVCAFIFRQPMAAWLFEIFPTINFGGILDGISSANILFYEVVAFVILLVIFGILVRFVMIVANFVEGVFKSTIVLALPSKVLGAIMGFVEAYVLVFIALFILTLPIFNFDFVNKSKYKSSILEKTPIVSNLAKRTINSFDDIYALKDDFINGVDRLELDQKVLEILIKNKVISSERAAELYEEGKINVEVQGE